MGKVVWHATMSLDGFIAGPDDAMEWAFEYDEPAGIDDVIASTGALLVGHNTYMVGFKEDQVEGAQEAYGGRWHGPQFVLTHDASLPRGKGVTFLAVDIVDAVAQARAAAGDKKSKSWVQMSRASASKPVCSTRSSCTSFPCCSVPASASTAPVPRRSSNAST
jgi:dihydrofolate reductase